MSAALLTCLVIEIADGDTLTARCQVDGKPQKAVLALAPSATWQLRRHPPECPPQALSRRRQAGKAARDHYGNSLVAVEQN